MGGSIVIMLSTLLLESIPQVFCAIIILASYSDKGVTGAEFVILPVISVGMTLTTILSDCLFLFRLCCGARCSKSSFCSSICCCCYLEECDASPLFDNEPPTELAAVAD